MNTCARLAGGLSLALVATTHPMPALADREDTTYLEAAIGFTRPPEATGEDVGPPGTISLYRLEPATDMAVSFTYGGYLSERTRLEAELSYAKVAWDIGDGLEATADGFTLATNYLVDIGDADAKLELGLGAGWTFFDEGCLASSGTSVCFEADMDDWNVQGIVGASLAISEESALTVRYRMQHIGGFSSEDRLHVFTVGYRRFLD